MIARRESINRFYSCLCGANNLWRGKAKPRNENDLWSRIFFWISQNRSGGPRRKRIGDGSDGGSGQQLGHAASQRLRWRPESGPFETGSGRILHHRIRFGYVSPAARLFTHRLVPAHLQQHTRPHLCCWALRPARTAPGLLPSRQAISQNWSGK